MRALFRLMLAVLLLAPIPALAGPPYATDDPAPTETGKWEIYSYVDSAFDGGDHAGSFGLDLNYGAAPGVQLTATLPFDFDSTSGGSTHFGDAEVGVKWRLINDEAHHRSVAIFPRVIIPTARGNNKASVLLPVWGQQDIGNWSIFGGGGYMIHPGAGNRGFWQQGVAVTNHLSDGLTIGAEVFHEGADVTGGNGSTLIGAGAVVHLSGPFSLLLSGGPIIEDKSGHTAMRGFAAILTEF
jgi:hypothetical protein